MGNLPQAASAELSVIAHATEDVDKVCQAARNILPAELRGKITFKRTSLTGHHGNPIANLKATLTDQNMTERFIKDLVLRLSSLDRTFLSDNLDQCIDHDGNLYLRFDKQAAYRGEIRLRQDDPIRMKLKFHRKRCKTESVRRICKEMGLIG